MLYDVIWKLIVEDYSRYSQGVYKRVYKSSFQDVDNQ